MFIVVPPGRASAHSSFAGGSVFLADGEAGLRVFDFGVGELLREVPGSPLPVDGDAWDVEVLDGVVYVALGRNQSGPQSGALVAFEIGTSGVSTLDMSRAVELPPLGPVDCGRFCSDVHSRISLKLGPGQKTSVDWELDLSVDDDRRWAAVDSSGIEYAGGYHTKRKNGGRRVFILTLDAESQERLLDTLEGMADAEFGEDVSLSFERPAKLKVKFSRDGKKVKLRGDVKVEMSRSNGSTKAGLFRFRSGAGTVQP